MHPPGHGRDWEKDTAEEKHRSDKEKEWKGRKWVEIEKSCALIYIEEHSKLCEFMKSYFVEFTQEFFIDRGVVGVDESLLQYWKPPVFRMCEELVRVDTRNFFDKYDRDELMKYANIFTV